MLQNLYYSKETKGTWVYACSDADFDVAAVTVLYIKKRSWVSPPKIISIEITDKDSGE